MSNFGKYSAYYDLLYQDKDYVGEADYVARCLRETAPQARDVLELGCGTGRHGRLLAERGFRVHGIERSAEMTAIAQGTAADGFTCQQGDICELSLGRSFDAVIALFHVISYQTSNDALQAAFRAAAAHLKPGGVFLFDVWHGPAVLTEKPSGRERERQDTRHRVKRTAHPALDTNASTVEVVFEMECEDRASGETSRFHESHLMRYLFPTEVDLLAQASGLTRIRAEEFVTGQAPSAQSWGVMYVLRK